MIGSSVYFRNTVGI